MKEEKITRYQHALKYRSLATRVNEVSSSVDEDLYEARDALWDVATCLAGSTFARDTKSELERLAAIREATSHALDIMKQYNLSGQASLLKEIEKDVIKASAKLEKGSSPNLD